MTLLLLGWLISSCAPPSGSAPEESDSPEPGTETSEPPSLSVNEGQWGRTPVVDGSGRGIGTLFADWSQLDPKECEAWSQAVLEGDALPRRIVYETTELAGTPVFALETEHPEALWTAEAANFALTLRADYRARECADCEAQGKDVGVAGTTTVLHRGDLFCLEPAPGDPDCEGIDQPLLYWWGRRTADPAASGGEPFAVTIEPFRDVVIHDYAHEREYTEFEIWVDLFKWAKTDAQATAGQRRDRAGCVLRLFELPRQDGLPGFTPLPPLGEEAAFPIMKDECYYEEPLNPFFNKDLIAKSDFAHKGRADHGLPNTLLDATAGWNCACEKDDCADLACPPPSSDAGQPLPRLQLVANNDHSKYLPLEVFCNANPTVCQALDKSENEAAFNEAFGLPPGSTLGAELVSPRRRPSDGGPGSVPWGEADGSGDRGVWNKARFKAGFDSRIVVVLRNEGPASYEDGEGHGYDTVYCDPATAHASARFVYRDAAGVERTTEPHGFECLACNYHAQDEDLPAPYKGVHAEYCPSHYGVEESEGIRLKSLGRMLVPVVASGTAALEVTATLVARNEEGAGVPLRAVRRFPVYIDAVAKEFLATSDQGEAEVKVASKEACWIGATSWIRTPDNEMVKPAVIPSALDLYLDGYLEADLDRQGLSGDARTERQTHYEEVDGWLLGGDVNRWFKRKVGDEASLMTLAGDVQTRVNVLDWFAYRGSSVHFEQVADASGQPAWVSATSGVAAGTSCPVLRPWLREDGYPVEMIRSTGQNRENGRSRVEAVDGRTEIHIDHCQETGKETIAPVAGFQFADQEQRGDAYIWFYIGRDWGWVSPFAQADGGDEIKKRFDLMSKMSMGVGRYDYEGQLAPWGSFIAQLDSEQGIDDLARSVAWDCLEDSNDNGRCDAEDLPTTFVNTAPLVVADLGQAVDAASAVFEDAPAGFAAASLMGQEGLLVWHAGTYRTSPLYLSFATRDDVLRPGRYWHFAGLRPKGKDGALVPVWSRLESRAVPVVWDIFGEFTVVDVRQRNASSNCEQRTVFDDFVLVYPPIGHDGIVLRQAEKPYGPFGGVVPLYGNEGNATTFGDELYEASGFRPLTAYSGYTHVDLWGDSVCDGDVPHSTKVRFNASIWTPYKTLLVEADVTRAR